MSKILSYGEILIRFSDDLSIKFNHEYSKKHIGGAELNSVLSLSTWGHECSYLSTLSNNSDGEEILNYLKKNNLCIKNIYSDHKKIGKYFAKNLNSKKNLIIKYDRKNSGFSKFELDEKIISKALKNKEVLIISGISPALSSVCEKNIIRLIRSAKERKIKIAYDVNYRSKLWSLERASSFNKEILDSIDFLFCNCGTARDVFGFDLNETKTIDDVIIESKRAIQFLNKFSKFELISFNIRNSIGEDNNLFGSLIFHDNQFYEGEKVSIEIKDCIGGGDSFLAAVIHGYLNNWEMKKIADFSSKTFANTHSIEGDHNLSTESEILNFFK